MTDLDQFLAWCKKINIKPEKIKIKGVNTHYSLKKYFEFKINAFTYKLPFTGEEYFPSWSFDETGRCFSQSRFVGRPWRTK